MRLVIKKGTGIRMNPSYKSDEQNERRCMYKNPSYKLSESDEENKEITQTVEYGTGVFSTELADTKPNLDEESCTEATSRSNSIEDDITDGNDFDKVDKENSVDGDESMDRTVSNVDEETHIVGIKRKYLPTSFVDSIINKTTEESPMATQPKIKCLDTSIPQWLDASRSVEPKRSVSVNECVKPRNTSCDIYQNERMHDMNYVHHTLSKIPSTEQKKWPQKACVHCRRKYGIRHDTRYICILCNAALCKEPCFSDYHYSK